MYIFIFVILDQYHRYFFMVNMERIKRPLDDTVHDYDNNKKQKLLVTANKLVILNLFHDLELFNLDLILKV